MDKGKYSGYLIMSKRIHAKHKLDRRMGENIWGRPKSPANRCEYGPGEHGRRRKSKISDFGLQLRAKQKLKGYYGNITERQFRNLFRLADKRKGDTSELLIGLLESRLDMQLYRAKFAPTVFAARQLVSHYHVHVNGRRVNIASMRLKQGDQIELSSKAKNMALVLEATQSQERSTPDYIETDLKQMRSSYLRLPKLADVPYPIQMEPNLVVEFYSR